MSAADLYAELTRQAQAGDLSNSPYVGEWEPGEPVLIDGPVDLDALAAALAGEVPVLVPHNHPDQPDGDPVTWSEYMHKDWILNLNQRLHWRPRSERTKALKAMGQARRRELGRYERASLHITVAYPTAAGADVHNYMPSAKAYVDGLIDIPETVKGMPQQPSRGS